MKATITLWAEAGPLTGKDLRWDAHDVALIGRAHDCHVRLPADDTTTSRHHAVLEVNPAAGAAQLRDLGSLNGTVVNGVRHGGRQPHETPEQGKAARHPDVVLADGDVIQLGAHRFRVAIDIAATVLHAADPRPGEARRCGGYELGPILGEGGFGAVYRTTSADGTPLALKTLLPHVAANPAARERFLREATTQAAVDHPNIVRLYDHGEDGDILWFTMEYCPGGSVADLMATRGGRLVADEAGPLLVDALAGLAAAHRAGVVHRDLKPHNVLLADGTAKIADLGLAKSYVDAGFSGMTVTGSYAGSWPYMPREQLVNFRSVKPTADVWSFGATAYHVLTGTFPRDERGFRDPAAAVLSAPVVPIRQRLATLEAPLADVVDRALALDPADRYRDASEMRSALVAAVR